MGLSENIRKLRLDADMTQAQLAGQVGVSRATVTQWESGWSQPRMGAIEKLANVFGVTIAEIVDEKNAKSNVMASKSGYVPLRGRVHAGTPTDPDVIDGKQVAIPQFLIDSDPDCYACESEGDCMNRVYPEGCIIVVSPNKEPINGSVAVVMIDGHDAVMRRMYRTANTLVLSPDSFNPENKDIVITADSDHTVEFGGKVVWFQSAEEME